jgi:DGQHR domain-containing protein
VSKDLIAKIKIIIFQKGKFMTKHIPALKVNQWLKEWDEINFKPDEHKTKPDPFFYIFSIKASVLRKLSGIQRREDDPVQRMESEEVGIQRKHDVKRSKEIKNYIKHGYPWSSLSPAKQEDPEYRSIQKPGWLPTSIVINILKETDSRRGRAVESDDLVNIKEDANGNTKVILPLSSQDDTKWSPKELPPIEVIDGQHRLWAFDPEEDDIDFEVPVVAFHGLDISWQAYLFWVINIKPKKIDPSLAFDMYPLLRNEDWLEKGEEHIVYRETRAQELVEILWSYSESPWYKRIEMLGGSRKFVSQSAWIRSLTSTFIKKWDRTHNRGPGGLFGSSMKGTDEVLGWSRAQQAAFLIYIWKTLGVSIHNSKVNWAEKLREEEGSLSFEDYRMDPAFSGKNSLLNTDQGVRAVLHVYNDIFYELSQELELNKWEETPIETDSRYDLIKVNLSALEKESFSENIKELSNILSKYDWRTSNSSSLEEKERQLKMRFKGSGGYKELRIDLLKLVEKSNNSRFYSISNQLLDMLK